MPNGCILDVFGCSTTLPFFFLFFVVVDEPGSWLNRVISLGKRGYHGPARGLKDHAPTTYSRYLYPSIAGNSSTYLDVAQDPSTFSFPFP